jgi:hypothetical protein
MKRPTKASGTKTSIKAGGSSFRHSRGLSVRSVIKAGGIASQHNRGLAVRG